MSSHAGRNRAPASQARFDVPGNFLAIFEADHSSSPLLLLKIASAFFDCVFRPIVTDRSGIVTGDFGNVTGRSGIVTAEARAAEED